MLRKTIHAYIGAILMLAAAGCGGSSSSTTAGVTLKGVVAGAAGSVSVLNTLFAKASPAGCPADPGGSVAINASPTDNAVRLATQYVRLLKEGGSDYLEISGCTHTTAADAEANEVTLGAATATICELGSSLTADAVATYDGIEMAIYYLEMTVPLIVPQIAPAEANYQLRVYFNDDTANGLLARDILIYDEVQGKWGWVDWDDMTALTYVGEGRPATLLDAFANDLFWCADCDTTPASCTGGRQCSAGHTTWEYKDPVTISTRDDSGGVSFSLAAPFSITSTSDATTVTMAFDVADTLTAWASQNQIDTGETTIIDISESCGFHPFFPRVAITSE